MIFAGKSDIQNAFRLLPLLRKCWKWLVMKARDPRTGKWKYFFDKCLPFGASISCALFQKFSDALCHLGKVKTNSVGLITNYLDDFLFIALTIMRCNYIIQTFLDICLEVGVPIVFEKTEWGSELIIFLGILLDGRFLRLAIPVDKRERAIDLLKLMMHRTKATVKELQCLCKFPLQSYFSRTSFRQENVCKIQHDLNRKSGAQIGKKTSIPSNNLN